MGRKFPMPADAMIRAVAADVILFKNLPPCIIFNRFLVNLFIYII